MWHNKKTVRISLYSQSRERLTINEKDWLIWPQQNQELLFKSYHKENGKTSHGTE